MIHIEHSGGYCVFNFSEINWKVYHVQDLIEEIKEIIPKQDREYNPDTKNWYVKESYRFVLNDLFQKYFADPNQIDMF